MLSATVCFRAASLSISLCSSHQRSSQQQLARWPSTVEGREGSSAQRSNAAATRKPKQPADVIRCSLLPFLLAHWMDTRRLSRGFDDMMVVARAAASTLLTAPRRITRSASRPAVLEHSCPHSTPGTRPTPPITSDASATCIMPAAELRRTSHIWHLAPARPPLLTLETLPTISVQDGRA